MGKMYGYARVSTTDQNPAIQEEVLYKAGCITVKSERMSGTTLKGRENLNLLLEFISEGDTLVVTRIDRLARSVKDLQDIVHLLREKGAHLQATEQPIDTSTAAGNAFLSMLGVFAEFETSLRRERQLEGIAKAKAEGKYKGRKATAQQHREKIQQLSAEGIAKKEIAAQLGISRASVYRQLVLAT